MIFPLFIFVYGVESTFSHRMVAAIKRQQQGGRHDLGFAGKVALLQIVGSCTKVL
jgi:hypothetical protein